MTDVLPLSTHCSKCDTKIVYTKMTNNPAYCKCRHVRITETPNNTIVEYGKITHYIEKSNPKDRVK